jgi:phosphoribosylformylglycinamidine (FGAM) synthase PurS component
MITERQKQELRSNDQQLVAGVGEEKAVTTMSDEELANRAIERLVWGIKCLEQRYVLWAELYIADAITILNGDDAELAPSNADWFGLVCDLRKAVNVKELENGEKLVAGAGEEAVTTMSDEELANRAIEKLRWAIKCLEQSMWPSVEVYISDALIILNGNEAELNVPPMETPPDEQGEGSL